VGEDLVAGVGDEEVVFEFHVSDSWCVDAGFDADGVAGLERCCFVTTIRSSASMVVDAEHPLLHACGLHQQIAVVGEALDQAAQTTGVAECGNCDAPQLLSELARAEIYWWRTWCRSLWRVSPVKTRKQQLESNPRDDRARHQGPTARRSLPPAPTLDRQRVLACPGLE
jgi:hypothetical protein